jgi:hypothetical protein
VAMTPEEQKAYEERLDKKLAALEAERKKKRLEKKIAEEAALQNWLRLHEQNCGVCCFCGSYAVYFDGYRDINICGNCGAHETAKGWQKP